MLGDSEDVFEIGIGLSWPSSDGILSKADGICRKASGMGNLYA